jgi:hypothetical protein
VQPASALADDSRTEGLLECPTNKKAHRSFSDGGPYFCKQKITITYIYLSTPFYQYF